MMRIMKATAKHFHVDLMVQKQFDGKWTVSLCDPIRYKTANSENRYDSKEDAQRGALTVAFDYLTPELCTE
jgi:hypothetical protein